MSQNLSEQAKANKLRYIREYDKSHTKIYSVKMRYGLDDDIIEFLTNSNVSIQENIRRGLRELIKKGEE